jgi:hypothetical protein
MKIKTITGFIVAAAIGFATCVTTPAQAAEPTQAHSSLNPVIAAALNVTPGGVVVSADEVVWPDGSRLVLEALAASTPCSSGKHCAYSASSTKGNRMEYATCPATNTALPFPVKSIINKRTNRTVTALNGSTVIATITSGQMKNVTGINAIACA